jgi:hypothetical protein
MTILNTCNCHHFPCNAAYGKTRLFEVGTGTGQHAAAITDVFAASDTAGGNDNDKGDGDGTGAVPLRLWQTSDLADNLDAINARLATRSDAVATVVVTPPPVEFNALTTPGVPPPSLSSAMLSPSEVQAQYNIVWGCNVFHISGYRGVDVLLYCSVNEYMPALTFCFVLFCMIFSAHSSHGSSYVFFLCVYSAMACGAGDAGEGRCRACCRATASY